MCIYLDILFKMDPDVYQWCKFKRKVCTIAAIIMLLAVKECILLYALCFEKTPQHTSILSGQDWINELIAGHDGWFYNEMGMQKHVFYALLSVLRRDGGLHDTKHVSCKEQLAIFLHYVYWGLSNQTLQEQFQRSGNTISKWDLCAYNVVQWAQKALQCLAVLDYLQCGAIQWRNPT
jgi:hypothetical protein